MAPTRIFQKLMYRPYGSSLTSGTTSMWLTLMFVMVSFAAFSEAWIGYSIARLCGCGVGVSLTLGTLAGGLIYVLDTPLVLLDVAGNQASRFAGKHWKTLANGVIRLVILAITIHFTLPAAAVSLVTQEIESEHQEAWSQAVDQAHRAKQETLERELHEARAERDHLQKLWYIEVNGRKTPTTSGKGGVGQRAKKIERDQVSAGERVARAERELQLFSEQMSSAALPQRSQALGVARPPLTLSDRYQILERIKERPGVRLKVRIAEGYLWFIVGAILTLKLVAPVGVRTYLDERLQQAWERAVQGGYKDLVAFDARQTDPVTLGPLAFQEWFYSKLPKLEQLQVEAFERNVASTAIAHLGPRVAELASQLEVSRGREQTAYSAFSASQVDHKRCTFRLRTQEARLGKERKRLEAMQTKFESHPEEELAFTITRTSERIAMLEEEVEETSSNLEQAQLRTSYLKEEWERRTTERTRVQEAYYSILRKLLELKAGYGDTPAQARPANDATIHPAPKQGDQSRTG